ncbi:MAG: glycosyltransferase family 4 protein [Symploca sp. SIO2E9]|nr:glycosyltransferase family 4 protein [Symploca sp. SIO2E9]
MKVLIALPIRHPEFVLIDDVLDGKVACSGSNGSAIRLAGLLSEAGLDVCLSTASESQSTKFTCIKHELVEVAKFDHLIVHGTHWNGTSLTFGNQALAKTILWVKNHITFTLAYNFLCQGGKKIVCPSVYHANISRALPQWRKKVTVIYNTYSCTFKPTTSMLPTRQPKPRLLFIGAITKSKGFVELTKIWSYLAKQQVNLELAIAGSISIHAAPGAIKLGSSGLGDIELETKCIQPWLEALSENYQPHFLGALSPIQLRNELSKSWAAIVNPGGVPETFCISAVEAQACNRTVFSVQDGALKETVYRGNFHSLAKEKSVESVAERIIDGLSNMEAVAENGRLAGEFVRGKFTPEAIRDAWISLLSGQKTEPELPKTWDNPRDLMCDLVRWSKTGVLINKYRRA